MKHILYAMTFMSMINVIQSQNLIPNHSFEKVNVVDSFFSKSYTSFNNEISDWSSPTQSSPDIIHEPYIESMSMEGTNMIRKNFFIKPLKPKTGRKFVGIKVYGCVRENTHCREYLQVKTLNKMEIGQCYLFSYYTNPLTNGSRINNIGVAFSETMVMDIAKEGVLDLGNRYGEEEIVKPGPGKWQEIKGTIKATAAWNYMIIGNFYHDIETMEIPSKDGYPYGYYLVDEVSLVHVNCDSGKPKVDRYSRFIYFSSNEFELEDLNKSQLLEIYNEIKDIDNTSIKKYGHADEDGTEQYNQGLSMRRSISVRQYFIDLGVSTNNITITGFGEKSPLSQSNKDKNRRVEIEISH